MADFFEKPGDNGKNGDGGLDARGRKRKNNFMVFYVVTMVIGVVVCIALFALAYSTMIPDRILNGSVSVSEEDDLRNFVRAEEMRILGMVTEVTTFNPRTVSVALLDSQRSQRFNLTESTTIQNRHGASIGLGEINLGQIVEITYDSDTSNASALSISGQAWEQTRSNVNIDLESATITIGNQVYSYSRRTLVLNQGEPFSIAHIGREDVLTLVGYQDKVWSIRVDTGHGFIRFENADNILGGTVHIGNFHFAELDAGRPVSAAEGTHRVIIEGQNIETFMADVVVRQGQTVRVDLNRASLRYGALQIAMDNPQNASVFINGEAVSLDANSVVEVEYGVHLIRVERPGYIPIQQEIELAQPFMRINIDLPRDETEFPILIETFPTEAQVFVNQALVGNSPVTIEVAHGNHSIVARMAGYEDQTLNITVDENSPRQYLMPMVQLPVQPPPDSPTTDEQPTGEQSSEGQQGNYLPPPPPGWGPLPTPAVPPVWPNPESDSSQVPVIPPSAIPPQPPTIPAPGLPPLAPPPGLPPTAPVAPPPELPPLAPAIPPPLPVPPPGEPAWVTHPEDLQSPGWPPSVEDLPLPPGFD